jgi:hypothetical protein
MHVLTIPNTKTYKICNLQGLHLWAYRFVEGTQLRLRG